MDIPTLPGFLQEVYRYGAKDPLHHSQVFFTVVGLEERREMEMRLHPGHTDLPLHRKKPEHLKMNA
jgi:hypothetical protein